MNHSCVSLTRRQEGGTSSPAARCFLFKHSRRRGQLRNNIVPLLYIPSHIPLYYSLSSVRSSTYNFVRTVCTAVEHTSVNLVASTHRRGARAASRYYNLTPREITAETEKPTVRRNVHPVNSLLSEVWLLPTTSLVATASDNKARTIFASTSVGNFYLYSDRSSLSFFIEIPSEFEKLADLFRSGSNAGFTGGFIALKISRSISRYLD